MSSNQPKTLITSVGGYLPDTVMTNKDLEKKVDTSDEWIVKRTGIKERRIVAEGETTSDMAYQACLKIMQDKELSGSDIDGIIVATTTPDRVFPSTAVYLQSKLGMPDSGFAFDLQAVCSGFIYALAVGDNFIRAGQAKRILVIGAESMSKVIDWSDRTTSVLFGDGAGAVLLEAKAQDDQSDRGILSTHLHSAGDYADLLYVDGGVCQPSKDGFIQMKGREVFKHAVTCLANVVDEAIGKNGLSQNDIDWLIPHQANKRIIDATARKLDLDPARVILTIDKHANTSAASVPLALYEGYKNGKYQEGDTLLLEAMGAGLTWGAAIVNW